MEAHPIPQNVTSFQFKLVGDMTLKQFFYLAIGVGLAYVIFVFFAHPYPYFSWPLSAVCALLGASFAFLPLQSRPLDYWVVAFLKAVYSPTKMVWIKEGQTYQQQPLFNSRLPMYLTGINQIRSDRSENQKISAPVYQNSDTMILRPTEAPILQPLPRPEPLPSREELDKTVDLAKQAQILQMKIIQTERTLSQIKEASEKPSTVPTDYSQQVNKILTDLQSLVKQASGVKQQIQKLQEPQQEQTGPARPISKEKVTVVVKPKPKNTQVALTTFPNVINGIVKDKENNYIEGVVAVIYDKEGLPVRALKTNKLGQFSGSTPLPNGIYTLELEKDNFTFDVLQIELGGEVLPPLLITAK